MHLEEVGESESEVGQELSGEGVPWEWNAPEPHPSQWKHSVLTTEAPGKSWEDSFVLPTSLNEEETQPEKKNGPRAIKDGLSPFIKKA